MSPGRLRPQNRVQSQTDKRPMGQTKTYIAPIAGLVSNQPMAVQGEQSAAVLENFWATTTGIEPRGGSVLRCATPGPVRALFEYRSGLSQTYFAADDTGVYEFSETTTDGATLTASVTGQSSGDYSTLEMQTDGGAFLSVVNGQDHMQIYDGANWQEVTAGSAPFAITNVATDRISHIWAYRNRQFMVEKGTLSAWYLGVNSVAGAATKLPLAGIFKKGGALLFGATWSSDSGAGMDDRCVFATDQGEFAVFSGGDPGNPNDWSLNGVFDLGQPLGRRSTLTVGGDLVVATRAGLIPISAALSKDVEQLSLESLSRNIDADWQREIAISGASDGWRLEKWQGRNRAILAPPQSGTEQGYCYAVNLKTGAWTKITGWRPQEIGVLGGGLYYGNEAGDIYLCDVGGTDDGAPFECRACLAFDHLGAIGAMKTAHAVRGTWRYRTPINPKLSVATDYQPKFGAAPSAAQTGGRTEAAWDTGTWDQDYWASGSQAYQIKEKWEPVSGHGRVLACQVQLTSSDTQKLDCELASIDLVYSSGDVLV